MNTCAICEHVSKPKLRKDVHSSGHQAAENNEESEVTQNISGGIIVSSWDTLLWEVIKI